MALKGKERVTRELSQLRNAIKRKYRAFRSGTTESELTLEKQYKPLLTELRKHPPTAAADVKQEIKKEEEEEAEETLGGNQAEFNPSGFSSPRNRVNFIRDDTVFGDQEEEEEQGDVSSVLSTAEGRETASRYIEEEFNHPLTKKYMLKMLKDIGGGAGRKIDHIYGPRYEDNTLMIGNKRLQFEENGGIRIGEIVYQPTEGLYELLFKRIPDDSLYDDNDLIAYKDILVKTSAHKRNYKYNGNVNRGNSTKYGLIIKNLFPKTLYGGQGAVKSIGPDTIYWDDPNELCDRLRLLVTSAETGNNGHRNEIISILEELREGGYIKGGGNSRLASLLK